MRQYIRKQSSGAPAQRKWQVFYNFVLLIAVSSWMTSLSDLRGLRQFYVASAIWRHTKFKVPLGCYLCILPFNLVKCHHEISYLSCMFRLLPEQALTHLTVILSIKLPVWRTSNCRRKGFHNKKKNQFCERYLFVSDQYFHDYNVIITIIQSRSSTQDCCNRSQQLWTIYIVLLNFVYID